MNRICICLFLLCVFCTSCSLGNKGKENRSVSADKIELRAEEVLIPPSDELLLKSYSLSASFYQDTTDILVAYNYKEHALDKIDLNSKETSQLKLNLEGPNGISRRVGGLFVHNLDSIWICDDTQHAYLLNRAGEVTDKRVLNNEASDGTVSVAANYAMSVIKLYYNKQRNSLFFAVRMVDEQSSKVIVKEQSLERQQPIKSYELSPSVVEPDITFKDYGYMCDPNVAFTDDKIIYNYPIESSVYVIDLPTMERKVVGAESQFTPNEVPKSSFSDYEGRELFALENVHFHEVMYLPEKGLYARLHVGGANLPDEKDRGKLNASRKLLLTLFDKDFRVVNELQLPPCRYSHYTGWCALQDGVLLFVDNVLSDSEVSEELIFDVYKPI